MQNIAFHLISCYLNKEVGMVSSMEFLNTLRINAQDDQYMAPKDFPF